MAGAKEAGAGTDNELIAFYGTECPHCIEMEPLIAQLEKEEGIRIQRLEVWHNAKNAALFEKLDNGTCGGVPFFFNPKTKKWIGGSTSYDKLKKWAKGQ